LRIEHPGRVTDRITLLGRSESCIYLVEGRGESAFLGGGLSYIIPDVLNQVEVFGIDPEKIKTWIIHHTHFDHMGAIIYLKERWPWIKVIASETARQKLTEPRIITAIREMNLALLAREGLADKAGDYGLTGLEAIDVDEIRSDGEVGACGDLSLEFIEAPGHSPCSMAVYIPEQKALFASDAGGIPFGDRILAAGNSNFDLYDQSLLKMARYDVEVYLSEHYGAFLGEDGCNFLKRSMEVSRKTRKMIIEVLSRIKDVEEATEEITDLLMRDGGGFVMPREINAAIMGQMTRFIARKEFPGRSA